MEILLVIFPERVNPVSFEETLLKYLRKSKEKKTQIVKFDFSAVEWCDLFELSLLIVWICDLRMRKKNVEFIYPLCIPNKTEQHHLESADNQQNLRIENTVKRRKFVCSYLNRWDFDDFLREHSVQLTGHKQDYPYWPLDPEQDSVLPITFFQNESGFESFLDTLRDSRQYELIFRELTSLSVIGSGGMRDTIIREVGRNIYDHAGGNSGFITMGIIPPVRETSSRASRYNQASELEKSFFRSLDRSGYLQVVIADNGPGIFNTLRDSYRRAFNILESDRKKLSESKVVEYSFKFDATSRPKVPEEGTGLFWVKEIAFQNLGFLTVRTGSSIVRYDFLSGRNKEFSMSNASDRDLKKLANLGGTQFKFYFPLNLELLNPSLLLRQKSFTFTGPALSAETSVKALTYQVVELRDFFSISQKGIFEDKLIKFFETLPKPKSRAKELITVIIDFADTAWTKDTIVRLLESLMVEQHERIIFVGFNADHIAQILSIASDLFAERRRKSPLKIKPILFVTESGFDIIGLENGEGSFVKDHIATSEQGQETQFPVSDQIDFVNRNSHLFEYDYIRHRPKLKINITELRNQLSHYYKMSLSRIMVDETKGIYYPGKFRLPSNSYVEGYFRISTLISYEHCNFQLQYILLNSILTLNEKPDYLVTSSSDMRDVCDDVIRKLNTLHNIPIKHLHLKDARDKNHNAALLFKFNSPKIVIINSVIGTAISLESVLDICQEPSYRIAVLKIFSIVDARDIEKMRQLGREINRESIEYRGRAYPLDSILSYPLKFHDNRPSSWRREDIRRIDPSTNAPDPKVVPSATNPLWSPVDEFYLQNVVYNTRSIRIGHYTRRHRHYIFFFDMARIAQGVGPEIATKIKKDVYDISSEVPPEVVYVVYDQNSRGANTIAENVASRFLTSKLCSIQTLNKSKPDIISEIQDKDIVICVNAVASGSHLQRFIHSVAECKPRHIYAYVIIHRKMANLVPFYQNIDLYAGIEIRIRYFVDIEIPVHSIWDCPACNRRVELRDLRDYCENSTLFEFINDEWEYLEPLSVDATTNLETQTENESQELVRQAILRREVTLSGISLPSQFKLLDILQDNHKTPDEKLRLLMVLEREIKLLIASKELFSPEFAGALKEVCISLLQNPADEFQRENSAITILRYVDPIYLLDNLVPILKGISSNSNFTLRLFTELLGIVKNQEIPRDQITRALDLCQESLEFDESYITLDADQIVSLGQFLNYFRRKLRIEEHRREINELSLQSVVAELWSAFVKEPGRVHPKLIQDFTHIIGIHSADSFRQIYKDYYDGTGNFAFLVERLIPAFDIFANCLRPDIKNNLIYFLSQGGASFSGDCEILDEALRSLHTLNKRGMLYDKEVDKTFYDNRQVSSAIDRLDKYAFSEDNSLLRAALIGKFTDIKLVIEESLNRWKERFIVNGIELTSTERRSEVFVPKPIITDVLDSFFHNIFKHAFDLTTDIKAARIIVNQQLEHLYIRICDTGKGISLNNIQERPSGGIRRSELLLKPYGGLVRVLPVEETESEGFSTIVEIQLLSKESILSWRRP